MAILHLFGKVNGGSDTNKPVGYLLWWDGTKGGWRALLALALYTGRCEHADSDMVAPAHKSSKSLHSTLVKNFTGYLQLTIKSLTTPVALVITTKKLSNQTVQLLVNDSWMEQTTKISRLGESHVVPSSPINFKQHQV